MNRPTFPQKTIMRELLAAYGAPERTMITDIEGDNGVIWMRWEYPDKTISASRNIFIDPFGERIAWRMVTDKEMP